MHRRQVNATAASVEVSVPCNTRASLCLATAGSVGMRLALDGRLVAKQQAGPEEAHACAHAVGCGAAGTLRRLAWVAV